LKRTFRFLITTIFILITWLIIISSNAINVTDAGIKSHTGFKPSNNDDTVITAKGDTLISRVNPKGDTIYADKKGKIVNLDLDHDKVSINMTKLRNLFKKERPKPIIIDTSITLPYPFKDNDGTMNYFGRKASPLTLPTAKNIKTTTEFDDANQEYILNQRIGKFNYRPPAAMTVNEYAKYDNEQAIHDYWMQRYKAENFQHQTSLIPKINIGGEAFDKIFGSSTIDIKPQGTAELIFGININKIANPQLPVNLQSNVSFDFNEKIQMSVVGKIGDKMSLGISYNTEAAFDFENTTKLGYTGDEDEIVKTIEAGNVSMPLNGTLITGSSALFGFKTKLQFGKLTMTSVLSQQKGQSQQIQIKGGAQTLPFKVYADAYEANKHFFLSHFFRDQYETALSTLPIISSGVNITRIEVWITNKTGVYQNARNVVGFLDLAENRHNIFDSLLFHQNFGVQSYPDDTTNNLYNMMATRYSAIRDINNITSTLSKLGFNFTGGQDYEKIENARLLSSTEYSLNAKLGYISLNSPLNADEILAVAYQYTLNGKVYQVGEFSTSIAAPSTLILKLIKGTNLTPKLPNWKLMMKNVYSIGAYQINPDNFSLDILYQNDQTGTAVNYINDGAIAKKVLLQVFDLDNLNTQLQAQPDGKFDFIVGVTVNPSNGRVYFPELEPFGSYLKSKINNDAVANKYIFQQLYDSTQSQAQQNAEKNKFFMQGTYQSSTGSDIALNAINIPQGSVIVTAGGQKLVEGTDFIVDYNLGHVTILNQGILQSGMPITISLESNQMFNIGTKTLIGTHFDYKISDKFNIGATIMHLEENPLTYKVSVGNEPISNTIWGLDMQYSTEVPFLTKMVDMIPFISTKEKSTISFTGEFAQLIPGQSSIIDSKGVAYIDDFEGSTITYDLKAPQQWYLASTPQHQNDIFPEGQLINDLAYGYNRSKLAWYTVMTDLVRNTSATPGHLKDDPDQQSNHFVREVFQQDLFPNMQSVDGYPTPIQVLNLVFYPKERGMYNYDYKNINYDGTLKNPEKRWGGITRKIVTNDFEASNIEFMQFWLMDPFVYEADTTGKGGDLFFNLGDISEDVLRDSRKSYENNPDLSRVDTTAWGRVPTVTNNVYSFDNSIDRSKQDVGLDGLGDADEKSFFHTFVDSLKTRCSPLAWQKAFGDPSSDDYHYFEGTDYDNAKISILDRYKMYNGMEGNSPTDQQSPESYPTSATQYPDAEDINNDNTLSENEGYFQYHVSIRPGDLKVGKGYITDMIVDTHSRANKKSSTVKWYQFKIPISSPDKTIGNIQDFKSIRFMRMIMRGFKDTVVMRFASLDLVRGEWRKYTSDLMEGDESSSRPQTANTFFDISAVNIEENATRTPVNYVLPPGVTRQIDPTNPQMIQLNEQSLELKVCDLLDGDARAIYRNVNLDVREYKHLRMFVHGEAIDPVALKSGDLTVFIRLGSDYQENYYEYEVPLSLTNYGTYSNDIDADRQKVWPLSNTFDINFDVLQKVKQLRNNAQRTATGAEILRTVPYTIMDNSNRVTVVGNPNLSNIRTIMLGIRNRKQSTNAIPDDGRPKCGIVWFDELRLTDFNESGGWAANGRLTARLADFATVNLSGNTSTPGFGSLESKLNDRQKETIYAYNFSSTLELGKFFPQRFGVKLPMYIGYSRTLSVPEYNPLDPDIPLNVTLNDASLPKSYRDSIKNISTSETIQRSINFTNVKITPKNASPTAKMDNPVSGTTPTTKTNPASSGIANPFSISNFSASYSYNETTMHDINTEEDLQRNNAGSLNYVYNSRSKNIEPFKKIKFLRSPYFALIRDFNFYLLPQQFTFRTDMTSHYRETYPRNLTGQDYQITPSFSKDFRWVRDYSVKFDLSKSLKFDFSATNNARIDMPQGRISSADADWTLKRDSILNNIKNFGKTTEYSHKFNLQYTVPINKIPLLQWLSANARYTGTYDWQLGPDPVVTNGQTINLGNSIKNSGNTQLSAQANLQTIYSKIPYIKDIDKKYFQPASKSQKKVYETVKYEEKQINLKANIPRNVNHKLNTDSVVVKFFDSKDVEIKGKMVVVNKNKIKFTTDKDYKNVKVKITGIRPPTTNILKEIFERTLSLALAVKNISGTYSIDNGMGLPGYMKSTKLFGLQGGAGGLAPGIPFIMGLSDKNFAQKAAMNDWITRDSMLNSSYQLSNNINFQIRTSIEPIRDLKIDLTATRTVSTNTSEYYFYNDTTNRFDFRNKMVTGNFTMTYDAINTMFWKLDANDYSSVAWDNFKNSRLIIAKRLAIQRHNAYNKYDPYNDNGRVISQDSFPVGYSALSQDVLIPAFLAAYANKDPNTISLSKFPLIPMPNWKITYDGLSKIDEIKKYFKTITITHNYISTYSTGGYTSDPNFSYDDFNKYGFSTVRDNLSGNFIPEQEMSSVSITEAFRPLFSVDMTMVNSFSFKAEYNRSRTLTMSFSDNQLTEVWLNEWVFGAGYRFKQLPIIVKVLGKRKKYKSDLNVRADVSIRDEMTILRNMVENYNQLTAGQEAIAIKLNADYVLNERFNIRAFYEQNINAPKVSTTYLTSNTKIGVSVRFTLIP